jgi:hypothetical protein
VHAVDVFRAGLFADQDDLLAGRGSLDRFVGGEGELAEGGTRRSGQTRSSAHSAAFLPAAEKLGSSSCVKSFGGIRKRAVFSSIKPSFTMSQAIFTAARRSACRSAFAA